jgi:hypothetical protein
VQNCRIAKLNNEDFKAIKNLIERKELVTKEQLSHLPTKDKLYGKLDKVIGELKAIW